MNPNNRICLIEGHQEYNVTHICTLNECNHVTRWYCSECLCNGVHNHNKSDNSHIMNGKQMHSKFMNKYDYIKKTIDQYKSSSLPLYKEIITEFQRIEDSLINFRNQFYYIEKYIQDIIQNFEQCLSNVQDNHFQQIDDDKLKQIINVYQYKFDQYTFIQQLEQSYDKIKKQFYQIEIIIKEYQDNYKKIDLQKGRYITQEIDQTNTCYYGSSISQNEKYLAYGGQDKLLRIYDIKLKKIIKEIKLDIIHVCQFTQDSSQLYVSLVFGYVCGYDVQCDLKEIFKKQIHSSNIYNIVTILNEYLITCSDDQYIIKTDIKNKQQLFKLKGHTHIIKAIDYNYKDDIIVSGSDDRSIKLWNCRIENIIINKLAHSNSIMQVQFINDNLNILSLDYSGNLYKWKIDLLNKDLIFLQQLSDQNEIYNFYQVNQDQKLLLICNNYAKILNQQGEILNTIEYKGNDLRPQFDCRQLDNMKYIQIRTFKKIFLATFQE